MNEQEAQQAQTIADIVKRNNEIETCESNDYRQAHRDRRKLLEIVDSQAQKLKDLAAEVKTYRDLYEATQRGQSSLQEKISEQAQTIATNAAYAIELQGKIAELEKTENEREDAMADFEDLYKVLKKYMEDKIVFAELKDAYDYFNRMRG